MLREEAYLPQYLRSTWTVYSEALINWASPTSHLVQVRLKWSVAANDLLSPSFSAAQPPGSCPLTSRAAAHGIMDCLVKGLLPSAEMQLANSIASTNRAIIVRLIFFLFFFGISTLFALFNAESSNSKICFFLLLLELWLIKVKNHWRMQIRWKRLSIKNWGTLREYWRWPMVWTLIAYDNP